MAFDKRTWVNVPDPSNYDGDLDSLPRFDADNMNRIEEGVEDAHTLIDELAPDDIGALSKTKYISEVDILSVSVDGWYYTVNCSGTPIQGNGYLCVRTYGNNYRIISWQQKSSTVEYVKILDNGIWTDWTRTITDKGGSFTNDIEIRKATSPAINIRTNNGLSQIFRNSSDTVNGGLVFKDYLKGEDLSSYISLILNHAESRNNQLSFAVSENGVRNYYKIFGEHNRDSMRIPYIQTRTYVGSGEGSVTLTFDFTPKIVFIQCEAHKYESSMAIIINGATSINSFPNVGTTGASNAGVTWSGNSVTFTPYGDAGYLNQYKHTYYCVALS